MTVLKCQHMVTASLSLCTLKCTLFLISLACLLLSKSKFKGLSGGFHSVKHHVELDQRNQRLDLRGRKAASPLEGVFQGPGASNRSRKASKKRPHRTTGNGRTQKHISATGETSSGEASGGENSDREGAGLQLPLEGVAGVPPDHGSGAKRWHARRRDPRMNGADIYVARITKSGCGNAKPCWRCLEWCKWAGVKRIFHWNETTNRFDVVKVNNAQADQYETHADNRLFAGLVRLLILTHV